MDRELRDAWDAAMKRLDGWIPKPRRISPQSTSLGDKEHMFSARRGKGVTGLDNRPFFPELIFCAPPRYARRYETLGSSHIISVGAHRPHTKEMMDWYATRRLNGATLIVRTDEQEQVGEAIEAAARTGARRVILGPSAYHFGTAARNSAHALWDVKIATRSKSERVWVYLTPVGASEEDYIACCKEMLLAEPDGLCIAPFVPLEWFDRMLPTLNAPERMGYHAHNPFASPFGILPFRFYRWLGAISTDAPWRAARAGHRYVDGVTAVERYPDSYKRWETEREDYPVDRETLDDADWNHMQLLRIYNGYVGAVPGAGERVTASRRLR